jgi:hypothetical protein
LDRTNSAGISELTKTRGAVIADFDNDNLSDIFLGRHQGAARLYRNDGSGHFTEINKGTFRATDRHGCDAADVNNDGLKDIFCATGAERGINSKRNELYVQRPDHTFVDRAAQYGVLEPYARGRSGTFVKANGDTNPDLFVANEIERADGMPTPDRLFINQAGGAFHYAPEFGLEREIGDGTDTGGNPDVADFDKDGWQDLLVEARSGLYLHHNNQGTGFTNIAKSVGLGQKPTDTTVADVNGDTWPDVIEVTPSALTVLLNTNGKFSTSFTASLSAGLAVAAGDVNGDGRPDIYVMRTNDATGANAPDRVYLNDGTGTNFTQMSSIPSASGGKAESVWPIDHDGNGLTDFLVLNGDGKVQGPVQLIAFYPESSPPTDTTSPRVTKTTPGANATGVDPATNVTATFSEDMMASSIDGSTFRLRERGSTTNLATSVSYDAATRKATLDPTDSLRAGVTYQAVVTTGAKDLADNPLDQNSTLDGLQQKQWTFTVSS